MLSHFGHVVTRHLHVAHVVTCGLLGRDKRVAMNIIETTKTIRRTLCLIGYSSSLSSY